MPHFYLKIFKRMESLYVYTSNPTTWNFHSERFNDGRTLSLIWRFTDYGRDAWSLRKSDKRTQLSKVLDYWTLSTITKR